MSQTLDLGPRAELVSMDSHCDDITIALYMPDGDQGPVYKVHTYSNLPSAAARITEVAKIMQTLGGMEQTPDGLLRFPCGHAHLQAAKRLFLDSCKIDPATPVEVHPLRVFDKKANGTIAIANLGDGLYEARPEEDAQGQDRRVTTIARGLIKLGEMEEVADNTTQARFACGQSHDELIGLLLVRAPNVRAAMREAEDMASRGVLSAPSAQE